MSELKTLKHKRGALKARLTMANDAIGTLFERQSDPNFILKAENILDIQTRFEKLLNTLDEFEAIQIEIDCLTDEKDLDVELTERKEFDKTYYSLISKYKKFLNEQTANSNNQLELPGQSSNSFDNSNSINRNVKLPTIDLPKFDGSYENWIEFRDCFLSLVHNNPHITPIHKYFYLRSALQGPASTVIKSLEVSEANYEAAWTRICERYTQRKLLVQNHFKALFSIKPLVHESAQNLRKLEDDITKHLLALKALKLPTDDWDHVIAFISSERLDSQSGLRWDEYRAGLQDVPTFDEFKKFLLARAEILDGRTSRQMHMPGKQPNARPVGRVLISTSDNSCFICRQGHYVYKCPEFEKLDAKKRLQKIKECKLCINCLRPGHYSKSCKFGNCKRCNGRHNTLLHEDKPQETSKEANVGNILLVNDARNLALYNQALLTTAIVKVSDIRGQYREGRVILDSGSQSNFVTADFVSKLGCAIEPANLAIVGINQVKSNIRKRCTLEIKSRYESFTRKMSFFILDKITDDVPAKQIIIDIPKNVKLADPEFGKSRSIDMLFGAGIFWELIGSKMKVTDKDGPILHETKLGWIVTGCTLDKVQSNICGVTTLDDVSQQLMRFWEVEEQFNEIPLSNEEKLFEANFKKTTKRDAEGRFIVTLPLKGDLRNLGNSREMALRRFYALERKLNKDKVLKERYTNFMTEYEQLGHMTQVTQEDNATQKYYLPHHGVFKEDSITTKLRVVFDGSAPSDTGVSINDLQIKGAVLQSDLFSILVRFRTYEVVVSSDIRMMYRQVMVHPQQRSLQRILWRSDPSKEIQEYNLNTITYGTVSGSFLAIRCLMELAQQCEESSKHIARIIREDFYVDDLLTGTDTVENAIKISKEIMDVLGTACFKLSKWSSNNADVLEAIRGRDESAIILDFGLKENTKTLGLRWFGAQDIIKYSFSDYIPENRISKRIILSDIAQIFDPLGLLAPCVIVAKIMLQTLWELKISWDTEVPKEIKDRWLNYKRSFNHLEGLSINRKVIFCKNMKEIQLHGFSDASNKAYGACIYVRTKSNNGTHVALLCAKSKVAPLKHLTIPRLELCGALLLARLYNKVVNAFRFQIERSIFWCDSTVVLGWLKTSPSVLNTFVANRVGEITRLITHAEWRHVSSGDNPADIASRGINPDGLIFSSVWWNGPTWLGKEEETWPNKEVEYAELPEIKAKALINRIQQPLLRFEDYSNVNKIIRIMAYVLRFIQICKKKENPKGEPFNPEELNFATHTIVKIAQAESFPEELKALRQGLTVSTRSKLLNLNPFIDVAGIIRVGGRLQKAELEYSNKHQKVLSSSHWFTKLLFDREHVRLLHAGPQALLYSIRNEYWPISGRSLARSTSHRCIRCFRAKPHILNPIMGNLPKERINPAPPFHHTGVDYAGPFIIKDKEGRGYKAIKVYMCLFVCFTTKAVHLELVTSLSAESFLATFRRFISRRGKPLKIFSDNGTNFVGASTYLRDLGKFITDNKSIIQNMAAAEGVEWNFIPPGAPHFGGLWESAVRSVKYHFKRVLGNTMLTFENMYTICTQVECILNSRPLHPMSSDPQDLEVLTPAHFLIGRPLISLPDENYLTTKENRLKLYQRMQQVVQHLWSRWSKEYLTELQVRTKWHSGNFNVTAGALVLIKQDNLPPSKWYLGRVEAIHPGDDGIVRVATIRTSRGLITRDFTKFCPLPLED